MRITLGLIVAALAVSAQSQIVWHVDADATPGGDGLSWTAAFDDLQPAMAIAQPGDEIWVAEGVYRPTQGGLFRVDARPYFVMPDGVNVLGGFEGTETSANARDPHLFETVISGDLNGDDLDTPVDGNSDSSPEMQALFQSKLDNANLLLFVDRTGPGTRLDGFTITGLMKIDPDPDLQEAVGPQNQGAIFVVGGEIEIANCLITGNLGGLNAVLCSIACDGDLPRDAASRFQTHPCVTGVAPQRTSRIVIDNTEIIDNFVEFAPLQSLGQRSGMLLFDTGFVMRDSSFGNRPGLENTAFTGNFRVSRFFVAGGEELAFERSRLFNLGRWGAMEARNIDVTLRDSIIEDVDARGFSIMLVSGGDLTMQRSIIRKTSTGDGNSISTIRAGSFDGTAEITDSVIVGNRVVAAAVELGYADPVVRNTAIVQNVIGEQLPQQPAVPLRLGSGGTATNLVLDSAEDLPAEVTDSIVIGFDDPSRGIVGSDPLFARAPSDGGDGWGDIFFTVILDESLNDDPGDLRLLAGSPAIDAGAGGGIDPGALDLDGNPRVADDPGIPGDGVDIGPYEFQGATCLADVNRDGVLGPDDFNAWIAAFNDGSLFADQNRDGVVNPADFNAWVANFNAGCP